MSHLPINIIPFTEFVLPNGRRQSCNIEVSADVGIKAKALIDAGHWFECETLSTGDISVTICATEDDEPQDVDIAIARNLMGRREAVETMINTYYVHFSKRQESGND